MKISTLGRHFREGGRSVFRNGWMSFASVSSITISLFILGLFLILGINLSHVSNEVESDITISAYLMHDLPDAQVEQIGNAIKALDGIKSVTFISKEEGLEKMRESMGDPLDGLEGENNPLSDVYEVKVVNPHDIAAVAAQIKGLDSTATVKSIEEVKFGETTIDNLFRVTAVIRYVALFFVVCLVFTSMFLISNTIKLTILARSREIKVMKLVGATNSFIRWPFFIEGALIGFLGSFIPTVILVYGYKLLLGYFYAGPMPGVITLSPYSDIALPVAGMLMVIGLVIGIWGSTISVRKFLRV